MKNSYLFIIFVLCFALYTNAQSNNSAQSILELSINELNKIGITLKNYQVVFQNDNPKVDKYNISVYYTDKKVHYSPHLNNAVPVTNFDFYPYYISSIDSTCNFISTNDKENILKMDFLFQRKMMKNYLVPVKIKLIDSITNNETELLYWFTPTVTFFNVIPERYKISRKYIPDTIEFSNVALDLSDNDLKKIGFIVNKDEIYIKTHFIEKTSDIKYFFTWYNNKTKSGTAFDLDDKTCYLNKKRLTDYYIVKVTDIDGKADWDITDFDGFVIPIFVNNKKRGLRSNKDIVIFLSSTPDLVRKLNKCSNSNWKQYPSIYTIPHKSSKKQ